MANGKKELTPEEVQRIKSIRDAWKAPTAIDYNVNVPSSINIDEYKAQAKKIVDRNLDKKLAAFSTLEQVAFARNTYDKNFGPNSSFGGINIDNITINGARMKDVGEHLTEDLKKCLVSAALMDENNKVYVPINDGSKTFGSLTAPIRINPIIAPALENEAPQKSKPLPEPPKRQAPSPPPKPQAEQEEKQTGFTEFAQTQRFVFGRLNYDTPKYSDKSVDGFGARFMNALMRKGFDSLSAEDKIYGEAAFKSNFLKSDRSFGADFDKIFIDGVSVNKMCRKDKINLSSDPIEAQKQKMILVAGYAASRQYPIAVAAFDYKENKEKLIPLAAQKEPGEFTKRSTVGHFFNVVVSAFKGREALNRAYGNWQNKSSSELNEHLEQRLLENSRSDSYITAINKDIKETKEHKNENKKPLPPLPISDKELWKDTELKKTMEQTGRVPNDGSCFYHSVIRNSGLENHFPTVLDLRSHTANWLMDNKENDMLKQFLFENAITFEDTLATVTDGWSSDAGDIVATIVSSALELPITVHRMPESQTLQALTKVQGEPIEVYQCGNHYEADKQYYDAYNELHGLKSEKQLEQESLDFIKSMGMTKEEREHNMKSFAVKENKESKKEKEPKKEKESKELKASSLGGPGK
ncbi:MAG: hypothetical protein FWD48_05365 [Oscillospiraceae bacterium]|nr:hypothetical protein [Oscillospiraceae bacterium]